MSEAQLTSALNLMRRMPPSSVENSLAGLIELCPDLTEELLNNVDQPLKVEVDPKTQKKFILCDYNRDGDSHRSPWSNEYIPAVEDGEGFLPSAKLRALEIEANKLFDVYRKLYFDTGISSVYFFDTDDDGNSGGFGACFLIHKDVEEKKNMDAGWWDSTHVFEVMPEAGKKDVFAYKITSTVMISMIIKDGSVGQVDLSGSMTKQEHKKEAVSAGNSHIANMGKMLEDMELRIRNSIEGIYIQKTREVINGMRSATGNRDSEWSAIADALKNTVISRK